MAHEFYTLDVFTDRIFGGNPLAIFPDATGIPEAQMQRVARELNLSETVFVLPPADSAHQRRLRIFTPGAELPFAGHPTVGTAHLLAAIGEIALTGHETRVILEEGVGPVPVTILATDGKPVSVEFASANLPEGGPPAPAAAALARVLSLEPEDIADVPPPAGMSCGVPFLFVPLVGLDALARARLNRDAWTRTLADFWAPQVFLLAPTEEERRFRARMFAPALGIEEDPATGGAAAALAGYLAPQEATRDGTVRWSIVQGVEMGRPSRINVETDLADGTVTAVRIGGRSVVVSRGTMEIPA